MEPTEKRSYKSKKNINNKKGYNIIDRKILG